MTFWSEEAECRTNSKTRSERGIARSLAMHSMVRGLVKLHKRETSPLLPRTWENLRRQTIPHGRSRRVSALYLPCRQILIPGNLPEVFSQDTRSFKRPVVDEVVECPGETHGLALDWMLVRQPCHTVDKHPMTRLASDRCSRQSSAHSFLGAPQTRLKVTWHLAS